MDNLTHTLLGVGMAHAGLTKRFGKGTLLFLAVASNFPDLDIFWAKFMGGPSFLHRRMLTHSVVGIPLLALAAAYLFHLMYKHISVRHFFGMGLLAIGVHVFYDWANSYGVVLLYPFSKTRFELAWVYIIDLVLWGLLIMPLIMYRFPFSWAKLERLSKISLTGVALYTLLCGLSHFASTQLLNSTLQKKGVQPSFTYIFPEALGPHRFRGVVKMDQRYEVYLLNVLKGTAQLKADFETLEESSAVSKIRQTQEAKNLEWFFKAPVWRQMTETVFEIYDIRFRSAVVSRRSPFTYQFEKIGSKIRFLGRSSSLKE